MFKHLNTEDFQNRDGKSPRSDIPVSVTVYNDSIELLFKNTSELSAKKFADSFCKKHSIPFTTIKTGQDGDYHDDWVVAYIDLKLD